MSFDSIVRISIDTQSLSMSQAGFGTPLIIASHEYWLEKVRSFSNLSELLSTQNKEKQAALPEDKRFINQPLYKMAETIFAQTPSVPKIKIGKRAENESVAESLDTISKSDEDGDFYGVLLLSSDAKKDFPALADAVSTRRLLAGVDLDENNIDIGKSLEASKGPRRIFSFYNKTPGEYPAAAWMGRMLAQPPGSSSWAFKSLVGITKAKLSTDLSDKLKASKINRHIDVNTVGVTMDGKVMSGEYIDIVHGIDWLHVRMQERLFRLLKINEKIPYTLKGIDLVRCEILAQLKEAVYRGLLAPDPEPQVSIPNIADISPAKRGSRILPDVCFSGRLAGAIHEIEIRGTVTV